MNDLQLTAKQAEAIHTFFDAYGITGAIKYIDEIFHDYLENDNDKNSQEIANCFWFISQLKEFLSNIEPDELKQRQIKHELESI